MPHLTAASIEPSHMLGMPVAVAKENEIEQPALGDPGNVLVHPDIGKRGVAPGAGNAPAPVQMRPGEIVAEVYFLLHGLMTFSEQP